MVVGEIMGLSELQPRLAVSLQLTQGRVRTTHPTLHPVFPKKSLITQFQHQGRALEKHSLKFQKSA